MPSPHRQRALPALHLGDIFQRPEVKDLLALLQVFIDRSGSGLLRISRLPCLEMPPEDVDRILAWLDGARPEPLSWVDSPPAGLSATAISALQRWKAVFKGLSSKESPWDVVCTLLLDRTRILDPHLLGSGILDVTRRIALGPKFLKLCGRVLYRQADIEAYEESCLATSTKTVVTQVRVS